MAAWRCLPWHFEFQKDRTLQLELNDRCIRAVAQEWLGYSMIFPEIVGVQERSCTVQKSEFDHLSHWDAFRWWKQSILTSRMALLSVATVITWYCFGWIISYPGRTRTPTCWFVESTSQVQSRQYSWNERPLSVCFFFTGTLWLRIWTCSHADDMQMLKSCADDMQTSEGLAWTLATFAATFLSAASDMLKTNWIYATSLHLCLEHQNDINIY